MASLLLLVSQLFAHRNVDSESLPSSSTRFTLQQWWCYYIEHIYKGANKLHCYAECRKTMQNAEKQCRMQKNRAEKQCSFYAECRKTMQNAEKQCRMHLLMQNAEKQCNYKQKNRAEKQCSFYAECRKTMPNAITYAECRKTMQNAFTCADSKPLSGSSRLQYLCRILKASSF